MPAKHQQNHTRAQKLEAVQAGFRAMRKSTSDLYLSSLVAFTRRQKIVDLKDAAITSFIRYEMSDEERAAAGFSLNLETRPLTLILVR